MWTSKSKKSPGKPWKFGRKSLENPWKNISIFWWPPYICMIMRNIACAEGWGENVPKIFWSQRGAYFRRCPFAVISPLALLSFRRPRASVNSASLKYMSVSSEVRYSHIFPINVHPPTFTWIANSSLFGISATTHWISYTTLWHIW